MSLLVWFVKTKMNGYDHKHEDHYREIGDLREDAAATRQQLKDHEKMLGRIESMCAEMRVQLITIANAVNGRLGR